MQATITSNWGGLGLVKNGCMNTAGYSTLRFALNGGSSAGQALYAALTDASGNALQLVDVRDYVSGGVIPANSYSQVVIPLAYLQAASTAVCGVFIQSATPTTFYVDQFEISTQGGSSEWTPEYSQAGNVVYAEGTGWGWHIGTWSNVAINPSSPIVYTGNNSIAVTTGVQWGRLKILTDADFTFNTGAYDTLSFYVNVGMSEAEALYVGIINSSGSVIQYAPLSSYTGSGTLDAYQWQPVRIPLSDLGATNQDVFGVEVQSSNPATFFIDEIQLLAISGGSCDAQ